MWGVVQGGSIAIRARRKGPAAGPGGELGIERTRSYGCVEYERQGVGTCIEMAGEFALMSKGVDHCTAWRPCSARERTKTNRRIYLGHVARLVSSRWGLSAPFDYG